MICNQIKKPELDLRLELNPAWYPAPESNRHGFPQVFETSASTNSASWAFAVKRVANVLIELTITKIYLYYLLLVFYLPRTVQKVIEMHHQLETPF